MPCVPESATKLTQILEEMKREQGDSFSLERINLAELGRRTGISRKKLRRLKKNGFQEKPHGLTGRKAEVTVLTGFTGVIDDLLRKGVHNSAVIQERLEDAGYCKRGSMENLIKECKSGFDMAYVSSSSRIVNANRMRIHALAYNLFNWFRRLTLPEELKKDRVDTLRLKLLKIAARVVQSSRYAGEIWQAFCVHKSLSMETIATAYERPRLLCMRKFRFFRTKC